MLKAVIFDFDGVIADSETIHLRSFNDVLAPLGVHLEERDYYNKYLGLTDRDMFIALADERLVPNDSEKLEELLRQKKQRFKTLAESATAIIDGVPDFLRMLEKNNILIAICSGALLAEIEMILDHAGLRQTFPIIVSADQVEKGKPDPEGFILTLEKLQQLTDHPIQPQECIVVEDSHWGLEAAQAAGMYTVAVTNSYDAEQLSLADKIVNNLRDLTIDQLRDLCR
jgi:HAD superfamily hydrolase (TIGR01509 family)